MVSGEKCVGYVSLADCALSAVAELGPERGHLTTERAVLRPKAVHLVLVPKL